MYILFAVLVCLLSTVGAESQKCNGNNNLLKSIQYQLKLVEANEGRCTCNQNGPSKVAFMVSNSRPITNLRTGGVVIYDLVDVNEGNGYDPSTGIFTAPGAGLYFFSWTTKTLHKKYFVTQLALNNKPIAKNYALAETINDNATASGSAVVSMTKDDKVCIKVDHGTGVYMHNNRWSYFNGFRF